MKSRQALIIGNDAYESTPLPCCVNDAMGMKNSLRTIGFYTHCGTDQRMDQMQAMATRFVQSIQPGSIAVFYFSGHGSQFNGVNYLCPVDNSSEIDLKNLDRYYLNVQKLVDAMEARRPRLMIIILDACRRGDELRDQSRLLGKAAIKMRSGLAPMRAPPGTIIAFACGADKYSYGQSKYGNHSVYTYHLLRHIKTPNLDIDLVLRKVAFDVQQETKNVQTPFRYSSCNEVICLVGDSGMKHLRGVGGLQQRMLMSTSTAVHRIHRFSILLRYSESVKKHDPQARGFGPLQNSMHHPPLRWNAFNHHPSHVRPVSANAIRIRSLSQR